MNNLIELYIKSLDFLTYTEDEKRILSVKEVNIASTTDDLGLPLPHGLSDPSMGSSEADEICSSCSFNGFECPGHFGIIKFRLPVYNPVFFSSLMSVLRGSCLFCHSPYVKKSEIYRFMLQKKVIDLGFIELSKSLEVTYRNFAALSYQNKLSHTDSENYIITNLEEFYKNHVGYTTNNRYHTSKIITEERQNLINSFLKDSYLNACTKMCSNCKLPAIKVRSEGQTMITIRIPSKRSYQDVDLFVMPNSTIKLGEDTPTVQYLTPFEIYTHLDKLLSVNLELFGTLFGRTSVQSLLDMFFLYSLLVTPPKFRPLSLVGDTKFENSRTSLYKKIVISKLHIDQILENSGTDNSAMNGQSTSENTAMIKNQTAIGSKKLNGVRKRNIYNFNMSRDNYEKLQAAWMNLQIYVNALYDSRLARNKQDDFMGLKQLLEKKEGMFRMNMMGKRVNQCARSVISPDPMLDVDEIGVPYVFASKLTYPEHLNVINSQKLISLLNNGPSKHPGATHIDFNFHRMMLHPSNHHRNNSICKSIMSQDITSNDVTVLRHMQNNDIVLMNRQPSLHRPSIMGHRVRVLPKERTIRLHYANCKLYNADFDGDEMNLHFPQSELGRSEGYGLTSCPDQYLSPRDAKPLAGLIQDYMVAGTIMTLRDRFLSMEEYHRIVYFAIVQSSDMIVTLPPAIRKPVPLYTGKQVISTLIRNCAPKNFPALNMNGKSKLTENLWPNSSPVSDPHLSDDRVLILEGELISGIFDKNQTGSSPYGLVHVFYEIYGGKYAYKFLSIFGRACIALLQCVGFSLGVDDIICCKESDLKREELLNKSRRANVAKNLSIFGQNANLEQVKQGYISALQSRKETILNEFDQHGKNLANNYQNMINKVCSAGYLIKKFPNNSLQMMIQAGAKGTVVNAMQISGLLGQMELEGRRPPLMISNRTLPCYESYDVSLKSNGFVESCFLSALQPAEYFFHCMAGREGLVDTAVKTSRSGYLQRCLIKHMEGVRVEYDNSVRDSDGSMIQFLYGEDGCDVTASQFFEDKKFEIFSMNRSMLMNSLKPEEVMKYFTSKEAIKYQKNLDKKSRRSTNLAEIPAPVTSVYPPSKYIGSVSESFHSSLTEFIKNDMGETIVDSKYSQQDWQCNSKEFTQLMHLKYIKSLSAPGEAVGILAGQSVGEPSTQMTLNTFHFAGRSEMNVTLGIPRLREIFLTGGINIKTPSVSVNVLPGENYLLLASRLASKLSPVPMSKIVASIDMKTDYEKTKSSIHRIFSFRVNFISRKRVRLYNIKPKEIFKFMKEVFIKKLARVLQTNMYRSRKDYDPIADIKEKVKKNDDKSDSEAEKDETRKNIDSTDDSDNSKNEECHEYEDDSEGVQSENDEDLEKDPPNEDKPKFDENVNENEIQVDKKNMVCWFKIILKSTSTRIPIIPLLKKLIQKTMINQINDVQRAFVSSTQSPSVLNIEGNLIRELWKHDKILDLKSLYSNNIQKVAEIYGIEAAISVLRKEAKNVFDVYGITVNPRHLSVLADYMSFHGCYKAFNRYGISSNSSPLQKMSFETVMKFLKDSSTYNESDPLLSPSARIIVGLPVNIGTELFGLIYE